MENNTNQNISNEMNVKQTKKSIRNHKKIVKKM